MSPGNDRGRPRQETASTSNTTDTLMVPEETDSDGHCCLALSIEQRLALGRRGLFCSETQCGRALLIERAS